METEKRVVESTQRKRKRKTRRIRNRRRTRNEKRVKAPPSLPNDLVEEIFLRLPVKALIRLKSLSKQWRSKIESRPFEERQLNIGKKASVDHPKIMIITEEDPIRDTIGLRPFTDIGFRTISLESGSVLSFTPIHFSHGFFHWIYVSESCDGLSCIHSPRSHSVYVVNPATRWLRQLLPARFQILINKYNPIIHEWNIEMESIFDLAFVKATDYKLVWLYNSDKYNSDAMSPNEGVTKCEVFDFRARLLPKINPAIAASDPHHIDMCTLDNGLCMSKRESDTMIQNIWRLKPLEDTWEMIFTIDLLSCSASRTETRDKFKWTGKDIVEPSTPVAVCKNKKILLTHCYSRGLVKYDPLSKSLDFFFRHPWSKRKITYFQKV